MKKEELVEIFSNLHPEDTQGPMHAVIHLKDGTTFQTDSLRIDMDGGRVIIAQQDSSFYDTNKRNWFQELIFFRNKKRKIA
ncbi:MAG: hypothetical protein VW146_05985 [Gammaproteobacteria bacterium]